MSHIQTNKGLDIPIEGEADGEVRPLEADGRPVKPKRIALNVSCFEDVMFKLHVKEGETVKIGQPLLHDKAHPERLFVSPAAGVVKEVKRGLKRRLLDIVIERAEEEEEIEFQPLNPSQSSREEIMERLLESGFFAYIFQRPFKRLANPKKSPRTIFINAIESEPLQPSAEMQIEGNESHFQTGLDALVQLTDGPVHLIHRKGSSSPAFTEAKGVEIHTADGPHPIGNSSVHIHFLSPIQSVEDVVWTIDAADVAAIGHHLNTGRQLKEKVISIAGPGVLPERRGFYRVRDGIEISDLIAGRIEKGPVRFVSGSVLTGDKVEPDEFLGFLDHSLIAIPEPRAREFLHFFRLGVNKYTASRTYLSGLTSDKNKTYPFTTSKHGEERGFVISSPYDRVMPMNIPTMHLVKAVLAEDYELAEELGLLEVDSEDFALSTFVDPCKIEMVEIVKQGLRDYQKEVVE